MTRDTSGREDLTTAADGNVPPLSQHPRVEDMGFAEVVFTRCLMNMPGDADIRLIGFNELPHTRTADVVARIEAINSGVVGRAMRQ